MALYIPINKTTGAEYPAINDEQKKANDSDPLIRAKYRYRIVLGSEKQPAPPPVEAKAVTPKTEEKEK